MSFLFKQGYGNVNGSGKLLKSDDGDVIYTGLFLKVRYGYGFRVENLGTVTGIGSSTGRKTKNIRTPVQL